jgi:hypothetical protein
VLYLKTPPTAKELTDVLRKLKIGPRALMRSLEPVFAELGLADDSLTDEVLIGGHGCQSDPHRTADLDHWRCRCHRSTA